VSLDLTWTDGRKFEIDTVIDVRQAFPSWVAAWGMRSVGFAAKKVYLFCDEG